VEYHGSLCLLVLVSAPAREWVQAHVDPNAMWFCDKLVVEPRYVDALIEGLTEEGLVVA